MTSCTCDCADGFSGSSCESELQAYLAHCSLTYFPTQRPDNIITFIVPLGRLYKGYSFWKHADCHRTSLIDDACT